jgi:catechol 2,3-dioxygenase-like lactoylglutathione lyase family enzyme
MAVQGLDHYTVNVRDLAASVRFYDDVLGLKTGPRPPLGFPGAWLYCGDHPLVHLVADRPAEGAANGAFDHVALLASGFDEMCRHLEERKIAYRKLAIPGGPRRQLFFTDPDGVKIELNFGA